MINGSPRIFSSGAVAAPKRKRALKENGNGIKAFRHGNQVRTDQNKPPFLLPNKEVCFDQYELDYLGRIKVSTVEMPYLGTTF